MFVFQSIFDKRTFGYEITCMSTCPFLHLPWNKNISFFNEDSVFDSIAFSSADISSERF